MINQSSRFGAHIFIRHMVLLITAHCDRPQIARRRHNDSRAFQMGSYSHSRSGAGERKSVAGIAGTQLSSLDCRPEIRFSVLFRIPNSGQHSLPLVSNELTPPVQGDAHLQPHPVLEAR